MAFGGYDYYIVIPLISQTALLQKLLRMIRFVLISGSHAVLVQTFRVHGVVKYLARSTWLTNHCSYVPGLQVY